MRKNVSKSGSLCLVWLIALLSIEFSSYSQQQIALVTENNKETGSTMPKVCLRQTINDTILPTLCNSGKGLVCCKYFTDKHKSASYNANSDPCKNSLAIYHGEYSDDELKILNEQQHFMQEQFQIQWQQELRMEMLDLQLGELIQGFYMNPPFK